MPRFYFHAEDGRCFPDPEGSELANLAVAKDVGLKVFGEILQQEPGLFWPTQLFKLHVSQTRDPADAVYTFALQGAVGPD